MAEVARAELLSTFQEITRIEDIQICIDTLEQHSWNLDEAVQSAIPTDVCSPSVDRIAFDTTIVTTTPSAIATATSTTNTTPTGYHVSYNDNETSYSKSYSLSSTSTSALFKSDSFSEMGYSQQTVSPYQLKFIVEHKNDFVDLSIENTKTVGFLKKELSRRLSIPVNYLQLKGWPSCSKITDSCILNELNLPQETKLKVHNTQNKAATSSQTGSRNTVTADSSKTTSTSFGVSDNSNSQKDKGMEIDDNDDDDDDDQVDDYDDDDDVDLINEYMWNDTQPKFGPLMPEDFTDETVALEQFTRGFIDRFGECHPEFYIGSLDDAIKDSLMLKAKERKPLAVYLHDDKSILTNVFCSKVLCSLEVVSYLTENFFVWAWDMTNDKNKKRLLSNATKHFGSVAAMQIKNYIPNQLPLLLIISRARSTNEVSTVIQGSTNLDELMSNLISAFELFQDQQRKDMVEEDKREIRESIKQQQDEAYAASLVADRLKEERRQRDMEIEREAQEKKDAEEKERVENEKSKAQKREMLAKELPNEPSEECKDGITQIRFHLPSGDFITRRFRGHEPLRYLFYFLTLKGYPNDDFKVLSRFPPQDVTQLDEQKSFEQLKLYPQVTLFIAER
ncbi:FAS-associated factor 1 [Octopus vulgaris]|uniref:FAS-associated factor 1 n=2 Tax=Octopus TaxID=6643 RepID=A0AA36AUX3_OCTVU|nr:FAS-associated factor 1 [Octopus sinensis]CAI9721722.1 FAS-associated factor 1 [Octopus vulgaris]